MKMRDLIGAADALRRMGELQAGSYSTKYAIYKLTKQAKEALDFYAGEEKKLAGQYGHLDRDGKISFDSEEQRSAFVAAREKLRDVEADVASLKLPAVEDPVLTPAVMLALDEIVEFEEG